MMHKVLIAHSSDDIVTMLESIISCKYHTLTCSDCRTATQLLRTERPDALILDLSLPSGGGLQVLEVAKGNLPPVILATTWFPDQAVLKNLASYGVDHVGVLPGKLGDIIYRLEDLVRREMSATPLSPKAHLRALRIPNHVDGYRQLMSAIPMYIEDPNRILSKEIYPVIAKEMGLTSASCVERSIRSAIELGWSLGNREVWLQYFPSAKSRPSIKRFLVEIALRTQDID